MKEHFATIITIGDELLIGQVIDTNSAWLAQKLNHIGFWVKQRWSIGDDASAIVSALDAALASSSMVIITGGLGPTNDDITKKVLTGYFDGQLQLNEAVLEHVTALLSKVKVSPLLERNRQQAMLPSTAKVLWNAVGTAPGMLFEKNGKLVFSLPGVPHEMKYVMENSGIGIIQEHYSLPSIQHKTLLTAGIGESTLAEHIQDWENQLPANIKLAYLPNNGMVRLRITGIDKQSHALSVQLQEQFEKLKVLVSEWLITDEDKTLNLVLGELLNDTSCTVGSVESCTGGYLAHLITSLSGSSKSYLGSIVSYANDVKENLVHVKHETIEQFGAVSEETIKEMVKGGLEQLGVNYVIATSGIMGPLGGSEAKPVGTVWLGVGTKEKIETKLIKARWDRLKNIEFTAQQALLFLIKFIKANPKANDC
jgi:nicotinamide-nucleotide amidase